jgi:spermidine/putrescine transport system ATP-binding protein
VQKGATLKGVLQNVVYFGTDTHFHVQLDGGSEFVVRQQNRRGMASGLAAGEAVGITISDEAAQVLRD